MSHCTKFNFQYVDEKCILKTFERLGLNWEIGTVVSYKNAWEKELGINAFDKRQALVAKKNAFQYFMSKYSNYYELSIEKHNMTADEQKMAHNMAFEFKNEYVKYVLKEYQEKLIKQGINCILDRTETGWAIRFGKMYERSVLINFDGKDIEEKVIGVKGKSCQRLTETLENMLSSPDVDLHTRWTEEYNQSDENELKVFTLGTDD